jgi:hypothetical protein
MHIAKDHLFHGAALLQIAEDRRFKAINAMQIGSTIYRNAYRINDNIGVFLKYGTNPSRAYGEYQFNFNKETREEIHEIGKSVERMVLALVCIKANAICCITHRQFWNLILARVAADEAAGDEEKDQIPIVMTAKKNHEFHVYVNDPHQRGHMIPKSDFHVPRNAFPRKVFPLQRR